MYQLLGKVTRNPHRLNKMQKWIRRIPQPLIYYVCLIISWAYYLLAPKTKKTIQNQINAILQKKESCRNYFFHLTLMLIEILFLSQRHLTPQNSIFNIEGEKYIDQALEKGKGTILYTTHTGNFFYYYWYLSQKYPCLTVATAGSLELRPLYEIFQSHGCNGLDYDQESPLKIWRALRQHLKNNGVVVLLGDFYRPNFPTSYLFGRETKTPAGAAVLSLENGIPLLPFYGYRHKKFQHHIIIKPPIQFSKDFSPKDPAAIQELNHILEELIISKPSQWFYWFNIKERFSDPL
ncbi:MAG TPA: lipid A biosynthesis acyltransferase [Paenibacillaceae bacterium]|nr:lipid A biosynthesis acyltransferase [Paenibacillaceae bacterium]